MTFVSPLAATEIGHYKDRVSNPIERELTLHRTFGSVAPGDPVAFVVAETLAQARDAAEAGQKVFDAKCKRCHVINGSGGTRGPNLSNVGGRLEQAALRDFIKDPAQARPGTRMPKVSLTEKQLDAVATYLAGLK